jgi:hypothetical protein
MKRVAVYFFAVIAAFTIGVSSSSMWRSIRASSSEIKPVVSLDTGIATPILAISNSASVSTIRNVDFANFNYPSEVAGEHGGFKLTNGELLPKKQTSSGRPLDMWLKLADVAYGDVTGDGSEEAIIDLGWITGGSAIPDLVYVYTLRKGSPKLLWAFETGDRADGGYKNIYAESGKLVVELQGKDKIIGNNLYEDDGTKNGDCCPTFFTRTSYEWVANRFRQKGEPEVFPIAER